MLTRETVNLFGLVGGGTSLEEMRRLAVELGVSNHVTFTGRVPDVVVNEMNDKSTMNKIMEYMALGEPIVQFDLAEGRFSAQEASLYARPNDPLDMGRKVVELLDDPERRRRMGECGRSRVENELEWRYEVPKLLAACAALWSNEFPEIDERRLEEFRG